MKPNFTIICLLLMAQSFSQGTTETEYNYMKKGYRQVAEAGMDVKKGYNAVELASTLFGGEVKLTFTLLKRDDGSQAGLIIKSASNASFGSGTNYYCIPAAGSTHRESFGWPEFIADTNLMTNGVKTYIMRWLSVQVMQEMAINKK